MIYLKVVGRKPKLKDAEHLSIVLERSVKVMLQELAHKAGMTISEKVASLLSGIVPKIYEEELLSEERRAQLAKVSPLYKPPERRLPPIIAKEER